MVYNLVVGYTIYNICKYYYYFLSNSTYFDVENRHTQTNLVGKTEFSHTNADEKRGVLNV